MAAHPISERFKKTINLLRFSFDDQLNASVAEVADVSRDVEFPSDRTGRVTESDSLSVADKNGLLFQYGINFNELPNWQKRRVGLYWESYQKEAVNRKTGEAVMATRRRITRNLDLPMRDEYDRFVRRILESIDVPE